MQKSCEQRHSFVVVFVLLNKIAKSNVILVKNILKSQLNSFVDFFIIHQVYEGDIQIYLCHFEKYNRNNSQFIVLLNFKWRLSFSSINWTALMWKTIDEEMFFWLIHNIFKLKNFQYERTTTYKLYMCK